MTVTRGVKLRRRPREIDYPESDGKPMAQSDLHRDAMSDLIGLLADRYAERPDVSVSGNLLRDEHGTLRLYDAATGERLLYPREQRAAAALEHAARLAAEAEVARLRAEVRRLQGGGKVGPT